MILGLAENEPRGLSCLPCGPNWWHAGGQAVICTIFALYSMSTALPRHNRHHACRRFFVLRSGIRRRGCRIAVLHSGFACFGVGCGIVVAWQSNFVLPAVSSERHAPNILAIQSCCSFFPFPPYSLLPFKFISPFRHRHWA